MFDDLEEESPDVTADSPDRALAWSIWAKNDASDLTSEEAWGIFHERYPDDPRFLLLNAYAEIGETKRHSEREIKVTGKTSGGGGSTWSAGYFLKKVERILERATDALYPQIKELLFFGSAVLAGAKDEDAKQLAAIRARIGADAVEPKRDERDRAGIRLRRFEREVLREIEERTQDNKPLGARAAAPAAPAPGSDWASAVADAGKPRRPYAADAHFARGELVVHAKFGVGVVTGVEPGRATILFESGPRKLVAT